eukprot:1159946-Pelagomonas_calceolata.AAC.1
MQRMTRKVNKVNERNRLLSDRLLNEKGIHSMPAAVACRWQHLHGLQGVYGGGALIWEAARETSLGDHQLLLHSSQPQNPK